MNKFTLMQKIRNKIKIKGDCSISLAPTAKLVNCDISLVGKNISITVKERAVLRYVKIEILGDNSSIEIGKHTIVGHGCYISAKEGKTLRIGDDCMLSRNAKLLTSDGHYIWDDDGIINYGNNIVINNKVWLADNVTVLKGVEIGENSVIGINATVTKNIPSSTIAAGNPAKIIKRGISRWEQ